MRPGKTNESFSFMSLSIMICTYLVKYLVIERVTFSYGRMDTEKLQTIKMSGNLNLHLWSKTHTKMMHRSWHRKAAEQSSFHRVVTVSESNFKTIGACLKPNNSDVWDHNDDVELHLCVRFRWVVTSSPLCGNGITIATTSSAGESVPVTWPPSSEAAMGACLSST